jgi:hypothetical protein
VESAVSITEVAGMASWARIGRNGTPTPRACWPTKKEMTGKETGVLY